MSARLLTAADSGTLAQAARLLRDGEVVAIPTETVYGLAVLPAQGPLQRLLEAKRRSTDKGIQLLIDSLDAVRDLVRLTPQAEALARSFWPGGLTLVLDADPRAHLPELLTGGRPTVGLRLPDHDVPRALARELGPLAASSANISGQPPATSAQQVMESLAEELSLVIDGGPVRGGVASSVVACPADGSQPVVLREGAVSRDDIRSVIGASAR